MIAQLSALLLGASIAIASPIVDRSPSNSGDATQSIGVSSSTDAPSIESAAASTPSASNLVTSSTPGACESPTIVTITVTNVPSTSAASATSTIDISEADANPTASVPVSRAGGVLQPSAAAEANPRDDTATRAFSSVTIKDASGQCLFIDPTSGDFRQNLIPVQVQDCDGSAGEKFDLITAGVHNNAPNSTLVVSSLTQGCLNFDPRRAAGDTVILFSCGGRADGGGGVTNSQLFPYSGNETTLSLAPENANGVTCLVPLNGKLDEANCNNDASQLYTIS